jgi:hypothetical protein
MQTQLESLLYRVENPSNVGGEYNQFVKPWETVETHVL